MLAIKAHIGEAGFLASVQLVLIGSGSAFFIFAARNGPSFLRAFQIGLVTIAGLGVAWLVKLPEEKLHILEYAVLGWFAGRDLSRRRGGIQGVLTGSLACAAVGLLDELIQGLLPFRFFNFRDLIFNSLGGSLGSILYLLCQTGKLMKKKYTWVIFVMLSLWAGDGFGKEAAVRLHFIDVGEGDSVLIETRQRKVALVDTGNLITGQSVLGYLREKLLDRLERLFITHPHLDHMGGLFLLLPSIRVEKIHDNGQELSQVSKSDDAVRWYEEWVRKDSRYTPLNAGDELTLDGVRIKALWPPREPALSDFNANSLVLLVSFKEFRCLLTGDLTAQGEKELLKRADPLEADVLKVGHHGAGDASSEEFLSAVSPKVSIISVNRGNIRGFPSAEVVRRLVGLPSKLYRTDEDGTVVVEVAEDGEFSIQTEPLGS